MIKVNSTSNEINLTCVSPNRIQREWRIAIVMCAPASRNLNSIMWKHETIADEGQSTKYQAQDLQKCQGCESQERPKNYAKLKEFKRSWQIPGWDPFLIDTIGKTSMDSKDKMMVMYQYQLPEWSNCGYVRECFCSIVKYSGTRGHHVGLTLQWLRKKRLIRLFLQFLCLRLFQNKNIL